MHMELQEPKKLKEPAKVDPEKPVEEVKINPEELDEPENEWIVKREQDINTIRNRYRD